MSNSQVKKEYEVAKQLEAFYTNGNVEWTKDGKWVLCQNQFCVKALNIENEDVKVVSVRNEDDPINCFTHYDQFLITSHSSGLFKRWRMNIYDYGNFTLDKKQSLAESELLKEWKYIHKGPISVLKTNMEFKMMISCGADSIVRLWDIDYDSCTGCFKVNDGILTVAEFALNRLLLVAGSSGTIYVYNVLKKNLLTQYSSHCSTVTAIVCDNERKLIMSVGRDRVLIVWDFANRQKLRDIPLFQSAEGIVQIPTKHAQQMFEAKTIGTEQDPDALYCVVSGENGFLSVWNVLATKMVYSQQQATIADVDSQKVRKPIIKLLYHTDLKQLLTITDEHTLETFNLKTFQVLKQFCGNFDEILDLVFLGERSELFALASNSSDFKVYDSTTFECSVVQGHTNMVTALATTPANKQILLTGSKDNSIRLWLIESLASIRCLAMAEKHVNTVTAVALSQKSLEFAISVSDDTSMKKWRLPSDLCVDGKKTADVNEPFELECIKTVICHDKSPSSVTVSTNNMIATASRDKTAKIWSSELHVLATLTGHKRGVLCVRFAAHDPIVLTTSVDSSIKIWSTRDYQCLKTLQGFECAIWRADFFKNGQQVFAAGADGTCKIFDVKTGEVVVNLNSSHEGSIFGLAISEDDSQLLTGCSQSLLVRWRDVTDEKRVEAQTQLEQLTRDEDELINLRKKKEYTAAFKKALELNRPACAMKALRNILNRKLNTLPRLVEEHLSTDEKQRLFHFVTVWNTTSNDVQMAQMVLQLLLKDILCGTLVVEDFEVKLKALISYTERHLERSTKLVEDAHFMNFSLDVHEN